MQGVSLYFLFFNFTIFLFFLIISFISICFPKAHVKLPHGISSIILLFFRVCWCIYVYHWFLYCPVNICVYVIFVPRFLWLRGILWCLYFNPVWSRIKIRKSEPNRTGTEVGCKVGLWRAPRGCHLWAYSFESCLHGSVVRSVDSAELEVLLHWGCGFKFHSSQNIIWAFVTHFMVLLQERDR